MLFVTSQPYWRACSSPASWTQLDSSRWRRPTQADIRAGMPARPGPVVFVLRRISARLQFLLGPRRRLGFWLGTARVDAVLVRVPATAGEERIRVGGTRGAVGFRQRITLPQFPHIGCSSVRECPGVCLPLQGARVGQQARSNLVAVVLGTLRRRANAGRPHDRVGGRLGTGVARISGPRLWFRPLG